MTVIVQPNVDSNGNPQPMVYDSDTKRIIVDSNGYVLNGASQILDNVPSLLGYINTPKTQTGGTQEAVNYSYAMNVANASTIGVAVAPAICFLSGNFQVNKTIVIPTENAWTLRMYGQGKTNSVITFNGSGNVFVTSTTTSSTTNSLTLEVEDMGFIYNGNLTPSQNYGIFALTNLNFAVIKKNLFASSLLFNSGVGSSVNPPWGLPYDFNGVPAENCNITGIIVATTSNNYIIIEENSFGALQFAYACSHDWLHFYKNECGVFPSPSTQGYNFVDPNGTNSLIGAGTGYGYIWGGVYLMGSWNQVNIAYNHYYAVPYGVVVNANDTGPIYIYHDASEAGPYNNANLLFLAGAGGQNVKIFMDFCEAFGQSASTPYYTTDINSSTLTNTLANPSLLVITNQKYVNPPSISTPSVPASGSSSQNANPYPVKVYINGGALTEIQITISGTSYTVYSNSTASAVYEGFTLPVGASITLTYSTAPTWSWVPE